MGVGGVGGEEWASEAASRGADLPWEEEEERDPDSAAVRVGESPLHPARAPKVLEGLHQENRIIHAKVKTVGKKLLKICF